MITLDKIKGKDIAKVSIILVIGLLILTLILNFIPSRFENATLERYGYDTTLADIHISIANNLLMTFITFLYVLLTVALVTQSKEQVAQSKVEVAQLKKEQQIRDIENRLEKFYIPAYDIINNTQTNKNRDNTLTGHPGNLYKDPDYVIGLKQLRKYSYLADKETYEAYEAYISSNCTSIKSTTCQNKYGDFTFCEHHKDLCHNRWDICPYNLEYCEYHPDPGIKYNGKQKVDRTKCVFDNTNCKYYVDLKKKIEEDIENYKNDLLNLKKY